MHDACLPPCLMGSNVCVLCSAREAVLSFAFVELLMAGHDQCLVWLLATYNQSSWIINSLCLFAFAPFKLPIVRYVMSCLEDPAYLFV